MEEVISRGDAEPAPPMAEGETVWYIPHHGVYQPQKPDKLRVVFDCSAKFHGVSLNDTLVRTSLTHWWESFVASERKLWPWYVILKGCFISFLFHPEYGTT